MNGVRGGDSERDAPSTNEQNKTKQACRVVSFRVGSGSVSLVRLVRTWLRMAPRAPDVFTTPEGVTLAARAFRPQRLVVRRQQSVGIAYSVRVDKSRRPTVGVSPQFGGVATRVLCYPPGSLAFQTRLCLASERESVLCQEDRASLFLCRVARVTLSGG